MTAVFFHLLHCLQTYKVALWFDVVYFPPNIEALDWVEVVSLQNLGPHGHTPSENWICERWGSFPSPLSCQATPHQLTPGFSEEHVMYQHFFSKLLDCLSKWGSSFLLPVMKEFTKRGEKSRCSPPSPQAVLPTSQFCLGLSPVPTGRRLLCQPLEAPGPGTPKIGW